ACYGIKIDHAERETTGVEGKAERLTWHKAWTAVSSGFSISYTSSSSPVLCVPDWKTCGSAGISVTSMTGVCAAVPVIRILSLFRPTAYGIQLGS
ncbi:hypothetical protein, partial [Escherichia coli]|uniref:hypothetical protein n=1 Tax=Escherichia coli TaxID=562 RepID=UPI00194E96EA